MCVCVSLNDSAMVILSFIPDSGYFKGLSLLTNVIILFKLIKLLFQYHNLASF